MSEFQHQATFIPPIIEEVQALFPAYDVQALIACGGMGAVYQATQTSLDRRVAIKILPREFSSDEEFRKSFEAEAKAMAKLNHPNLIGVYDFGEVGGMLYIVMEYVDGKSLFHSINGSVLEQSEALRLVINVCHGLAHAHEFGVLHRDIKPCNILLDAHANPKIGDFGLAHAFEREILEGEQIYGTPGFTAPEVVEPPYTFDHRADIFSVGVMLHELLTGKLPDADPRSTSQVSGCNPRIDAVIRKATQHDPNARYGSANELALELEKINTSQAKSIITGTPTRLGRALAAPPRRPPTHAPAKPVPGSSALGGKPRLTTVNTSESSSGMIILIIILVIAAIIALFVLNREAPSPPTPPDTGKLESVGSAPKTETKTTPESNAPSEEKTPEISAGFDSADYLARVRRNTFQRLAPDLADHRRGLMANSAAYGAALEATFEEIDSTRRAAARSSLLRMISDIKKGDHRIPDELPRGIAPAPGSDDIHKEFLEKQTSIDNSLNTEFRNESGIYVLEIQDQLERLDENTEQPAINALSQEVRLVKDDLEYFKSHLK